MTGVATSPAARIDPILLSVLQRRFKSITEEMGQTLLRTTRSPILSEARDFVTGLYDAQGRMLEQTEYIPVLAFALHPICEFIIDYYGDDIHDGDVILHNDVFSRGNQNADVAAFKPVFHDGELVAWAACKGHQADIGGAVAGGYNPEAREVWQEALRIPPVKVYAAGRFLKDVWDLIFANVRYDIVAEDIKAEIGGCVVGERAVQALFARYGHAPLLAHIDTLFDRTERMVRSEIARIPDGTYHGESMAFYDGVTDGSTMKINLAVTVAGEAITFDFAGSSPQTPGFVNAPYSSTASAVMLTFLMLINPDIPHNDGILRPITITIPEGTFLNAKFPAATTFGNSLTGPTSDSIFRALSHVLPETVSAGWNRMISFAVTGTDPRHDRPYVDIFFLSSKGGSGATWQADGYDHIGLINCAGGILAQDYEMFEIQDPHFLVRHEYWPDSAGAGEWRGGLGTECEIAINGEGVTGVSFGDGIEDEARAFGLYGGTSGVTNQLYLTQPDGTVRRPKAKEVVRDIPTGSVFVQQAGGGGGGYGDPHRRATDQVANDVKNELISIASARTDYGVVIDAQTFEVDVNATQALRAKS